MKITIVILKYSIFIVLLSLALLTSVSHAGECGKYALVIDGGEPENGFVAATKGLKGAGKTRGFAGITKGHKSKPPDKKKPEDVDKAKGVFGKLRNIFKDFGSMMKCPEGSDCCHQFFLYIGGHGVSDGFRLEPTLQEGMLKSEADNNTDATKGDAEGEKGSDQTRGLVVKKKEKKPPKIADFPELSSGGMFIEYSFLKTLLQELPECMKLTIFLDACHSGGAVEIFKDLCEAKCGLTIIYSAGVENESPVGNKNFTVEDFEDALKDASAEGKEGTDQKRGLKVEASGNPATNQQAPKTPPKTTRNGKPLSATESFLLGGEKDLDSDGDTGDIRDRVDAIKKLSKDGAGSWSCPGQATLCQLERTPDIDTTEGDDDTGMPDDSSRLPEPEQAQFKDKIETPGTAIDVSTVPDNKDVINDLPDENDLTDKDYSCPQPPADHPINVGSKMKVGTGAGKLAGDVAKGLVGGFLGGGGRGRSDDFMDSEEGPETSRDPIKKKKKTKFNDADTGTKIRVGAVPTKDGLLFSTAIDKAPGKGTFQTVFLEDNAGRRMLPVMYYVYKIWAKISITVSWTRSTYVDGQLVNRESGGWSESWTKDLGTFVHRELGDMPVESQPIWERMGYGRATQGVRGLGTEFPITVDQIKETGPVSLVVHITRPKQNPVTTVPFIIQVGVNADGDIELTQIEQTPATERWK